MKPVLWVDKKVFEGNWTTMALVSTAGPPSDDAVALYANCPPCNQDCRQGRDCKPVKVEWKNNDN